MRLGVVVAFPGDFDHRHVGVGIGIVGAQIGDVLEGVDCSLVLLRVEQGDAVVVPAHPFLVFVRTGRDGGVVADAQRAGLGCHLDDGHGVVLAGGLVHGVVGEMLVEAAVLDGRGDGELALVALGQAEAVARQLRAARLEHVVVGQHAVVPDLVNVVELALDVDEAVGEGVRRGIEFAVGLDEAALGQSTLPAASFTTKSIQDS